MAINPKTIEMLGQAAVTIVPGLIDHANKNKEEKSFFEKNKSWIFMLILSIFAVNLSYFNLFESVILNSLINMTFGIIVLVLIILFFSEEKSVFKIDSRFIKALLVSLIILGSINSVYHISYAVLNVLKTII